MTEFNWDNFIQELKKFQKGIENIGGEFFREFKIGTPAKEEEILEIEVIEYQKILEIYY